MMRPILITSILLFFSISPGQGASRDYVPPLRIFVPFEAAWKTMRLVLEEKGFQNLESNRGQGLLQTNFKEYMSGALTEKHLSKLAEARRLSDGSWVKLEYQYEVEIQLINERETLVTAYANIRALKRDFLGETSWVKLESNGSREEELLVDFGKQLFGERFVLDVPEPGFWERDPEYVPDISSEESPSLPGPERP